MKTKFTIAGFLLMFHSAFAQNGNVGINTSNPRSTLEVSGSLATSFRTITSGVVLDSTYSVVSFNGVSPASVTLPDASGCKGRTYVIKNATAPVVNLTIVTTGGQTIDGTASWGINQLKEAVTFVSNGSNWEVAAQVAPAGSSNDWTQGGNALSATKNLGTTSNHDLPIVTNNTERMRVSGQGNVAIGSSTFDATNPEKLLINAGATSSVNALYAKGSINSYFQINIQNQLGGTQSSSDLVATANNGTETTNFVNLGINGSGFVYQTGNPIETGKANDGYLISSGNDFYLVNNNAAKDMIFLTGGTAASNEAMRITSSERIGIGTTNPSEKLELNGNFRFSGALMPGNAAGTSGYILTSGGAGASPSWVAPSSVLGESWNLDGNSISTVRSFGTTTNKDLPFITNSTERMRISAAGNVAVGNPGFNGPNPEKFLVDAGVTSSVNAIVAKGSVNNYFQLNIKNESTGTSVSSDIVATANNGSETTNYIDMGINGSAYTGGVMGNANDGYLYNLGQNLLIGTGSASKSLIFVTGGTSQSTNERMRIDGSGNVAIGSTSANSKLQVNGSLSLPVVTKSSGYTATASDYTILCNSNSGAITIALPAASGVTGRIYVIKKTSANNTVTIDPNSNENIDGATTKVLSANYESVMVQSDGSNWFILSKN